MDDVPPDGQSGGQEGPPVPSRRWDGLDSQSPLVTSGDWHFFGAWAATVLLGCAVAILSASAAASFVGMFTAALTFGGIAQLRRRPGRIVAFVELDSRQSLFALALMVLEIAIFFALQPAGAEHLAAREPVLFAWMMASIQSSWLITRLLVPKQ
jgi:hypothetical protein